MITDVSIVSTNLNYKLVDNYKDYFVVKDNFKMEDLLKHKNVIFFNCLNNLEDQKVKEIFSILKDNQINFINVTNNMEQVLLTSYLKVYDKENVLIEGSTIEVLKSEKLLKRIGLELPFMVELSLLLKDYNLIDKIYLDKESLVNDLWK